MKLQSLIPDSISHLIGRGNYTIIVMADGKQVLSSITLYKVCDFFGFVRISKQTAVNLRHIDRLEDSTVVMQKGDRLEIARRRLHALEYLQKKCSVVSSKSSLLTDKASVLQSWV